MKKVKSITFKDIENDRLIYISPGTIVVRTTEDLIDNSPDELKSYGLAGIIRISKGSRLVIEVSDLHLTIWSTREILCYKEDVIKILDKTMMHRYRFFQHDSQKIKVKLRDLSNPFAPFCFSKTEVPIFYKLFDHIEEVEPDIEETVSIHGLDSVNFYKFLIESGKITSADVIEFSTGQKEQMPDPDLID